MPTGEVLLLPVTDWSILWTLFLKINLSRDYDETSQGEQKVFLKELGPFRTLASKDSNYAFLCHLCTLWFQHWLLQLEWYLDHEGMNHHEEQIWNVRIFPFLTFSQSDIISSISLPGILCGQHLLLKWLQNTGNVAGGITSLPVKHIKAFIRYIFYIISFLSISTYIGHLVEPWLHGYLQQYRIHAGIEFNSTLTQINANDTN